MLRCVSFALISAYPHALCSALRFHEATSHLYDGRRVSELENTNMEKDRLLKDHNNQRNVSNFPKTHET